MAEKRLQKIFLHYFNDMTITVFTPTYNRAHLLDRLYLSLCRQTCQDFEWLIVDDGSSDNTKEIIERFIIEKQLNIRYFFKENGGKHTAINRGVKEAKGKLFWILDSDDSLPVNAIELVLNQIPQMKVACGICGYMAHHTGEIIGNPIVSQPLIVSSIEMRYKLGITGDMMEVFLTSVLSKYPFPEIKGERFCPEVLVWYRIAKKHKFLLIPNVIYYRDYMEGGLSDNIVKIRMKSPIGTMMTYSELFDLHIPFIYKLRNAINYWRFAFCTKDRSIKISSWGNLIAPLGWLMHLVDKRKVKV